MEITNKDLQQKHLRYTKDSDFIITRQSKGKGFIFVQDGKQIHDDRVEHLAIPPGWHDVKISKAENSHIQAIGYDDRGRKQYIYHPKWIELQQENKFDKVVFFGEVLPEIRKKVKSDLQLRGLAKEKVVATIVWLLEHTLIRIGNERYADENNSFGLTTIQNKHVEVEGSEIHFAFKGKSGVYHNVEIHDKKVAKVIHSCLELPEQELFEYIEDGSRKDITSDDVNAYLKSLTGEDITAKDFRTWGGTVYAGDTLYDQGEFKNKTEAKKIISQTIKAVSKHLRNTAATCRKYYVHPAIITSYQENILIPHFESVYKHYKYPQKLFKHEYASWTLLKEQN